MSDTIVANGKTYTVYYVDATATGANDGSSPTDAKTTIPSGTTLAASTCYLIRRSATALTLTVGTNTNADVWMLGMPLSTDTLYKIVPAAARSAWGADVATRATIQWSTATSQMRFSNVTSGAYIRWEHLAYQVTGTSGTSTTGALALEASGCIYRNNTFSIVSITYADATLPSAHYVPLGINEINAVVCDNTWICSGSWIMYPGPASANPAANPSANSMIFCGNTINYWGWSGVAVSGIYYNNSAESYNTIIENNTINMRAQAAGGVYGLASSLFNLGGGRVVVKNFTLTGRSGDDFSGGAFAIFTSYGSVTPWNVQDVTITLPRVLTGSTVFYYPRNGSTFKNITVNVTYKTSGAISSSFYVWISDGPVVIQTASISIDVNANPANGYAFSGVVGPTLDGVTIAHGTLLMAGAEIEVAALTNNAACTSATSVISATNGASIYVQSATLAPGLNKRIGLSGSVRSMVFIDNCDIEPDLYFNGNETSAYYCANEGGLTGNWHSESLNNKITVSADSRTGGRSFSLLAEGISSNATAPYLYYAPRPYDGVPVSCAGTSGLQKVILYYAAKGYTSIDPRDLVLEVEIPEAASGTKTRTVTSLESGVNVTDTSVWSDAAATLIGRIEVTFNLLRNEQVHARIAFRKYLAGGYVLLDPTFAVAVA